MGECDFAKLDLVVYFSPHVHHVVRACKDHGEYGFATLDFVVYLSVLCVCRKRPWGNMTLPL